MVKKSPFSMTLSPGTPWGRLVLLPVTTMGSKELPSEPWRSMR